MKKLLVSLLICLSLVTVGCSCSKKEEETKTPEQLEEELHLNTNEFKRLKFGISNNKFIDTKDYVLGKFTNEEETILTERIKQASKIALDFIRINFDRLMSDYN